MDQFQALELLQENEKATLQIMQIKFYCVLKSLSAQV